jgi:nucleoside-diphosphate-sugar epimerase
MKIILTGITGNLGSELAHQLLREKNEVISIIRSENVEMARGRLRAVLGKDSEDIKDIILGDLEKECPRLGVLADVDCIINAAGIVHFKESCGRNAAIAKNVLKIAEKLHAPLYHASTAFVWKTDNGMPPRNDYEEDKQAAEAIITESETPWCIVRPSILIGETQVGAIMNFTGYYMIIQAFLSAASHSDGIIRFPFLTGRVNMIPIDLAAGKIIELVHSQARGIHFVTNGITISAQFALEKGLKFFDIDKNVSFLHCSIREYEKMELTSAERRLFNFLHHFQPYWEGKQEFPNKEESPRFEITDQYLETILSYARSRW